ncbi:hypothetical protein [Streptomyces sp. NPDC090029]|uniref:hypothetical protein n=1 Tax=Streptomyces sp. NPDC090029 TaxID=3365924 RepID=UPI003815FE54
MPFPTSDVLAAHGKWMYFSGFADELRERHPELASRVYFNSGGPRLYVKVRLSGESGVGLAITRMGTMEALTLITPELGSLPSVWAPGTPREVLVDALAAQATARLAGEPVPSPWRWNQSQRSDVTDLADLLADSGVTVRRVVTGNRWFAYGAPLDPRVGIVERAHGDLVEAELPGSVIVRASLMPRLGWLLDCHLPELNAWGRVDLSLALGGRVRPTPGTPLAEADVHRIADLIGGGPAGWSDDILYAPVRCYEPPSPFGYDPGDAVLAQLPLLGFRDLEPGVDTMLARSETYHVLWRDGRDRSLSKPELERLNGVAAAAGSDRPKRLILVTAGWLSKPAAAFADQARAFVFHADPDTGRLEAVNPLAREAMPPRDDPRKHDPEPW